MIEPTMTLARTRPKVTTWVASLAILTVGLVTIVSGQNVQVAGASTVGTSISRHITSTAPSTSHTVVPALRSIPVHLSIPAIGVSTSLVQLGLLANGSPQVPSSWHIAGWYKFGPTPGQVGSSVILGHVDSVGGPAIFYRLNQLKIGSKVVVKLADGKTVIFQVTALHEYLKTKFPLQLVYGPRPYPALQLVTCGGTFNSQTHHYLSSIVAFTKEVGA
jgi:hypothetical protein